MAEIIAPLGFLQIYTNQTHAGLNYKNLKEIYMPAADFSYDENYEHPITHKKIKGSWFFDEGYEVMTPEQREPRHYCIKGKASFSFIGTSLIIRLMLDSGQGKAEIFIDGKRPSEIGAYGALDELDCNLDHYGFGAGVGMRYHDVTVVEGLADGAHTCEICADNKRGVYFTLGGAKIHKYEIDPFAIHGYHARETLPHNQATLRLVNTSKYAARNIVMNIPARYINRAHWKTFPQPYTVAELGAGEQIALLLSVDGSGYEDAADVSINVTADYGMKPHEGYPTEERAVTILPHDKKLTYAGDWIYEELGLEHYLCAHTDTRGDSVSIRTNAHRVEIDLLTDYGYPRVWADVNGKVAANWSLHADDNRIHTFTLDNLGHDEKTVTFYTWLWGMESKLYEYGFAFSSIVLTEGQPVTLVPKDARLTYTGAWQQEKTGTQDIFCACTEDKTADVCFRTTATKIEIDLLVNWSRSEVVIEIDGIIGGYFLPPLNEDENGKTWRSSTRRASLVNLSDAEKEVRIYAAKWYETRDNSFAIAGIEFEEEEVTVNPDPDAPPIITKKKVILDPSSKRLIYEGTWAIEPLGPKQVLCAHTETKGSSVSFRTTATTLDIQLKTSWGRCDVFVTVDGDIVASFLTGDAKWRFCKIFGKMFGKYGEELPNEQGQHPSTRTHTIDNLRAGGKTIRLYATQRSYTFAFSKLVLHETISYLHKSEHIPIRMTFDYIKPFGVRYLKFLGGGYDYEGTSVHRRNDRIPRWNMGAKEVKVMRRYPTFALNYSDRNHGNLKYYDIVIVDPGTVTRREVAAWQRMGIKVFGYVSFGEEDGVLVDPWDVKSGKRPHIDDGAGVGGYASYYAKGGNGYAELNQCLHDGLIETGEKKCLLSDTHYFTGAGCCTRVCRHDTRMGYPDWESGGTCGGGHTRRDNWQRTASEACTNAQCPHYAPYHGGCPHYAHHDGWGQDLSYTTPDYPDQNGIWGSSYVNPLAPRWKEKLASFYLRRVFGLPKLVTEKVRLNVYNSELVGISYTFRTSEYPIDKDEPVHLYSAEGKEYRSLAYSFDPTTGAFQVDKNDVAAFGDADAELTVSYHVVGMGADGVFMDTLDTVDVYPSEAFQQGMARMINELKAAYPQKQFIANRGFSILKDIIASCSYVMFETFISEYNWETKQYHRITDPAAIAFNEEIKELLRNLRRDNVFEVLALNYCADDATGDALREQIAQECYAEGYLSWSSNIQLDDVLRPYLARSDAWKENVKQDNPFFGDVPAVDSGWVVRIQNEVEICGDYTESNRIWQRLPAVERDDWYEVLRFPVVGGYLEREVTTLAWCWRLALADGRVLGFTSCDMDLIIDGETYESCTGFAPTAVSSSNDLATDNLDVDGMISSERITEEDIFLGVYDNAKIRIFICDYEHTENHFILREGTVGKITAGKTAFKAEIRGLMDAYQQQVGQTYQRKCRARLGDAQCQCSIVNDTVTGKVTAVRADGSIFTDVSRADDFFTYGVLTFSSGVNKGASYEVEQSIARNGQIRFFSPPLHEIVVGDTFHLVPGCNGEPDTCKKRFHNLINFRGEPYIPGNDYAAGYPLKTGGNIVPAGQSVKLRSFEFQT